MKYYRMHIRKVISVFLLLFLSLTSFCQRNEAAVDISNHILDSLHSVLKLNFVPVHALLLILGGIAIKKYNIDVLIQSAFRKGWKRTLFKIDFLVFYLNMILIVSFIRFESYFMISEVGLSLSSRLIALIVTFGTSVLFYQYALDYVFRFLNE